MSRKIQDVQYEQGTSSVCMTMCTAGEAHHNKALEKGGAAQRYFRMNHDSF